MTLNQGHDVNAVAKGRVGPRIERRVVGRVFGRILDSNADEQIDQAFIYSVP